MSCFYPNQSNFYELFFQLAFLPKKKAKIKTRQFNCLVLPHASYGLGWKIHDSKYSLV